MEHDTIWLLQKKTGYYDSETVAAFTSYQQCETTRLHLDPDQCGTYTRRSIQVDAYPPLAHCDLCDTEPTHD